MISDCLALGCDLCQLVDDALEQHLQDGRRILLVHGGGFTAGTTFWSRVHSLLTRHGRVWRFQFSHSPTDTELVPECIRVLADNDIDLVVAIGGGRVMDIAKVCACLRDFDFSTDLETVLGEQHALIPPRRTALVAIPTTPGTGSEATPYAVLTGEHNRKLFAISKHLRPDAGIIFPPFYTTVPAESARQSLVDGFTHALEALWARRATPKSDAYATRALEIFHAAMIPFYRQRDSLELSEAVATAAALGGLAFGAAYTSLCHALSFPLAQMLGQGHGQCCALTAAQVAEFNSDYETPALQHIVRVFGLDGVNELPEYIRTARNNLEDKATLSSYGVTERILPQIAARTQADMVSNNAKFTTTAELVGILRNAL